MAPEYDWTEFLSLAAFLFAIKPGTPADTSSIPMNAVYRSAVSRAYYAAFQTCLRFAEKKLGYTVQRNGNDHKNLPGHLRSNNYAKEAGLLEQLKGWRHKCDYEDKPQNKPEMMADWAIKSAGNILSGLNTPRSST